MNARSRLSRLLLGSLAAGLLLCCGVGCAAQPDPAAYEAEVEAWRQNRDERLRADDGWLALAGLYWLGEGANRVGSGDGNDVVFPPKAPAEVGTFYVADSTVTFEAAPGAEVTVEGTPVQSVVLATDADEDGPTVLAWGSLAWHLIDRDGRLGIRLKDSENPPLTAFEGMEAYPIDRAWRIEGRFERYDPPRTLQVPTILDTVSPMPSPGAVVFERDGATHRLDVTGEPTDSSFFVIFADRTNGPTTYEAGRYLYVDAPDADGRIVIDFNKAYNPPCVFTPYATCPFPPPQNRLALAVEAGEKKYGY